VTRPQVVALGVDGGANVPGPDPNTDAEVMLDIEVAGAVAPGAKIAVYLLRTPTRVFSTQSMPPCTIARAIRP